MKTLKRSDLEKGLKVMINPKRSKNGVYGNHLGKLGVITKVRSGKFDPNTSCDVKLDNDEQLYRVAPVSLCHVSGNEDGIVDSFVSDIEKDIKRNEIKISDLKKDIKVKRKKIEYLKETKKAPINNRLFKKWAIANAVDDQDMKSDEKKKELYTLIDL